MRTVEIFVTVIVVLAVVALGVLLIHLLNSQHAERIAAFRYGTGARRDLSDGERGRVRRRRRTRNGVNATPNRTKTFHGA
ncbi:hypothetical protein ACFW5I_26295 [Streptomyces sp. NPDC058818]|uniref:hypothetical protein n=1 Tax=Streptomyces sp. NPDC058818 TaxID=3346640 RepID=UPI0036A3B6B5